jgi:hypothetical protein
MIPEDCTPTCPRCHSRRHVIPSGQNVHTFACRKCQIQFEDGDDGEVGYGRPEKYAERNERHENNRQQKLAGRLKLSTDFRRFNEGSLKGGLGR